MKSCSFLLLRRKRSSIFFLLGLLNPRIRRWQSVSHHLAPVVRNRSSHRMVPPCWHPFATHPTSPRCRLQKEVSNPCTGVFCTGVFVPLPLFFPGFHSSDSVLSDVRSQEPISSLDYDCRMTNRGVGSRRPGRRPICYIFS